MSESDLSIAVLMVAAGVMTVVVVYVAVTGAPGVVSLSPPAGSPRWPVYGFFIPWFLAGLAARSNGGSSRELLWIRLAMFLIVLVAFVISWQRLRKNPASPPRSDVTTR